MQAAIADLVRGDAADVRRCAVIVPTRAAGEELRRTLENISLRDADAVMFPDLLTRAEFYERLHATLAGLPRRLTPQEREVLLRRASRNAAAPPFTLRSGLILEMLRFYDELRRREQSLDDFSRLVTGQLAATADTDRGAERLLRQTEFLASAYSEFERLTHETDGIDEHGLRALLIGRASPAWTAYRHVVVTVADEASDSRGLYASDFDLLARIAGIERVDVVATENLLAAGFHERIRDLLPGAEEVCVGSRAAPPVLAIPETTDGRSWFTSRDREEELADVVRDLKHRAQSQHEGLRPPALDRCAVVFQRPLPYLYLAAQVFPDGAMDYQTVDELPLSGEPFAAALDLVLSFLAAEAGRASTIALLASPHFQFPTDEVSVDVLDRHLRELRFSGGWDNLEALPPPPGSATALSAVRTAAAELAAVRLSASASGQLDALSAFVRRFERLPPADALWRERHLRARVGVLAAIEALSEAHASHDDGPLEIEELSGSLRRWIDAQTFAPRTGTSGLRLLDSSSAPYSDVDELRVLGLVEGDWPEPSRRSIFYPHQILAQLGWPPESARTAAARARFRDLMALPSRRISASTFTLEEDAIVAGSPFLEEVDFETASFPRERTPAFPPAFVFMHEALAHGADLKGWTTGEAGWTTNDSRSAALQGYLTDWLALRTSRSDPTDGRYRGMAGPRQAKTYAVSHVERYLECPFKFYAAHVLSLPEERDEEPGLTPLERGHFIHAVFERFFAEWQASGRQTITAGNVADALAMFERIVDAQLERLPEADRAVERTHLVGSAAASGLAERAFAFEIEQGGEITERLLERSFSGPFEFAGAEGARTVAVRAKADRIDLMADGSLRVIDYKLGRAPKPSRALQLPVYGICAEQALDGYRGRAWKLQRAGYVAFKEKDPFVPLGRGGSLQAALEDGQAKFLAAIDRIERGEFPVDPDEPFRCQWCGYSGVCRKDYVGDE